MFGFEEKNKAMRHQRWQGAKPSSLVVSNMFSLFIFKGYCLQRVGIPNLYLLFLWIEWFVYSHNEHSSRGSVSAAFSSLWFIQSVVCNSGVPQNPTFEKMLPSTTSNLNIRPRAFLQWNKTRQILQICGLTSCWCFEQTFCNIMRMFWECCRTCQGIKFPKGEFESCSWNTSRLNLTTHSKHGCELVPQPTSTTWIWHFVCGSGNQYNDFSTPRYCDVGMRWCWMLESTYLNTPCFFVLLLGVFWVLVLLTNHGAPLVCGSRALDPSQAHETVKQWLAE